MGYLAAVNIHQLLEKRVSGSVPEFVKLDEIPPMIGLAVGKKAVAYWPEGGTSSGEDVMDAFFGNDLGFTSKYIFSVQASILPAHIRTSLLEPSPAWDQGIVDNIILAGYQQLL